jgi:hypothetical protein
MSECLRIDAYKVVTQNKVTFEEIGRFWMLTCQSRVKLDPHVPMAWIPLTRLCVSKSELPCHIVDRRLLSSESHTVLIKFIVITNY